MYDGGNEVSVDGGGAVTYMDSCEAGDGYSMDVVADGISVMVFESVSDTISISGNLGADGGGQRTHSTYAYGGYTAFWKQTHSANDPAVTHIWITDAANAVHSGAATTNTDSDADGVSGLGGAAVIYLLWGESAGAEVDEAGFRAVVEATVDALPAAGAPAPEIGRAHV